MYNRDYGVIFFTVPNQYSRKMNKRDINPHYILCSVDKLNSILYSFDDDGGGSALLPHWVIFTKILKENNKNEVLLKEKSKNISKYIQR